MLVMLGFPAIFYIVKKQSNFLSLSLESHLNDSHRHYTLNLPTSLPLKVLPLQEPSFNFENESKSKREIPEKLECLGIISKTSHCSLVKDINNTQVQVPETGQRKKPLRDKMKIQTWNRKDWIDIEFALKTAAPVIFLCMSSFTISSYCSYHKISKMLTKIVPQLRRLQLKPSNLAAMYSSSGGDAGAIREAGGAFAQKERAQEAQYFNKLQQEQIAKLRNSIEAEIKHHEEQIKRHQEAIERHKKSRKDLGDHK